MCIDKEMEGNPSDHINDETGFKVPNDYLINIPTRNCFTILCELCQTIEDDCNSENDEEKYIKIFNYLTFMMIRVFKSKRSYEAIHIARNSTTCYSD